MGLLSRFITLESRTSLDNSAIPLSSDSIISILGTGLATDSGIHVSEFNSLRLSAMWRCVSLISGACARLPLNTYAGVRDAPGPRSRVRSILDTAPDSLTLFEFKEQIYLHLLLWGNAYIRKVESELGGTGPAALVLYRPWEVTPSREATGKPKRYQIGNETLDDSEIIHIPGLGYDGIRGLSPIQYMRQTIGLGVAAEEFGARLFGNGSLLGGILTSDKSIPQDKAEQLKNRWRDKVIGLARAHEVAVLDNGVQFHSLGIPPDDAQFLQTRQFGVEEIGRWYGVPIHLLNAVDKTTSWGAGIAEQSLGFVRYTIGFWTSRVEQRLDAALPPGQYAAFDLDELLRGDTQGRYNTYHTAIFDGWITRAEVRERENLPPASPDAGLDQFLVPLNDGVATSDKPTPTPVDDSGDNGDNT